MSWPWSESESEEKVREHNEGQEAGSDPSFEELVVEFLGLNSESKSDGFTNGMNNPSKDD